MLEVRFGRKIEPSTLFVESDRMLAIRAHRNLFEGGALISPLADKLPDTLTALTVPHANVAVFDLARPVSPDELDLRKRAIRDLPDVRFAGNVLLDAASGEPVLYTENIFAKFVDGADREECRRVLGHAGLTIKSEPAYAENAFFAAPLEGTGQAVFGIAQQLLERPDVEFCHPEIIRRRARKAIFPQQWHLQRTTVGGVVISASANVRAAHRITKGEGVIIAVIDDGVDIDHPEFAIPGKVVAARDATLKSDDPRPKDSDPHDHDDHGTACAGVACAAGRDGASGVAPQARLMPIRITQDLGSQAEAEAFWWAVDHGADVISCSWGADDGEWDRPTDPLHWQVTPLPASTRLAIDFAVTRGRGGRGCVVLFAAGNGNEPVETDGYASYERVITVAACNDRGVRSGYSDYGKAIWCAFPSDDLVSERVERPEPLTPGIWTTDRSGRAGYNRGRAAVGDRAGNYTNEFGGTSSACPGAAGIAALVLSVNPDLTADEVRGILRDACDRIDAADGGYDAAGHSPFYGYGRLNGARAVRIALARRMAQAGLAVGAARPGTARRGTTNVGRSS